MLYMKINNSLKAHWVKYNVKYVYVYNYFIYISEINFWNIEQWSCILLLQEFVQDYYKNCRM